MSSRGGAETLRVKPETLLLLKFVCPRAASSPREIMFSGLITHIAAFEIPLSEKNIRRRWTNTARFGF